MGLRLKMALYVVAFVGATLGLVALSWVSVERDLVLTEMRARGVTLLRSFSIPSAVALANNDTPTLDGYVEQFAAAAQQMDLRELAVLDFGGRVVAHTRREEYGKVYGEPFVRQALAGSEPASRITQGADGGVLVVAVPVTSGLRWGTLMAGFSLARVEAELDARRHRLLVGGLVVSGVAVAIAYLALSFSVIGPLLRMRAMAQRVAEGRLDARVSLEQDDELGELARQLDRMAEQIESHTEGLEKLVAARTHELENANEQLQLANTKLERLARTDPLTGLFNRRHFMEQLQFEVRRGQRSAHHFTVVMMDVDHFKHFNDTNGHTAGDELLQRLAALLEINLRATDVIGRYGGEEFIVLLLDTGAEEGYATAQKLQQVVAAQPFPCGDKQPLGCISVSVGVAFYPQDGREPQVLIERADQGLYSSKVRGRNRVTRYADLELYRQRASS